MDEWSAAVYPHGRAESQAENLWLVRGSLPRGPLPRNMVIHRTPSGRLWLHSALAMDAAGMAALEALGEPGWLVVPNGFHRLDAARYKERYPGLRVLAPAAACAAVEKVVAVDGSCEEELPAAGIRCLQPAGVKPGELIYEIPVPGGVALVATDLWFHLPHQPGFGGLILRLMGSSGAFGMTRIGRWMMLQDKAALRRWMLDLAARDDIRTVLVAHGDPLTGDCGSALRQAAERL